MLVSRIKPCKSQSNTP